MDPQTKSAIKQLVLDLRHTLEDELAIMLRRYGVFTDRKWSLEEPPERLTDEAEREIWQRIVAVIRRGMKEGRILPQASQDYVRESAFTFLNRLVGLKCLEVRGIIDEVITTRDIYGGRSKAHRDYRDEHPHQARAPDDALPACLEAVCRRVDEELIGYLFDPDDDHSLVWPRYPVLKSCIEKINALDESAWAEDEIIGWIYQFYNAEEKVAIRKRGKPQTPHGVAVINQFFTPRWIVKFLVDNTLGRLWLEMHPDSPRVRAKCDYLVPEPLPADDAEIEDRKSKIALDPDSPINNPHAAPRRGPKPITQIKLLDPACGTMHFGHYACEVFDAMYRDARDWGEVEITDERIPSAILEYNLFGVDIDRRAVQLAALSLFMKARTMHPEARVRQVNLVVADATMPDSQVKKKFLARYARTPAVQKAFAQVLDDMDNVAQVGSLLRVEERLRELLARAGHAAVASELDARRQRELPGFEPDVRQMGLAEVVEEAQAKDWTPHYTLQELRDDLRAFAREALQEHDVNAQLFATEADKAVRLLDVLMGEYDVVVMNPPYGYMTDVAKTYIRSNYPDTYNDLYAAFIERSFDFAVQAGYTGALTSRSFMFLPTFQKLRENLLLRRRLVTLAELGLGILDDASVRVSAHVVENSTTGVQGPLSVFFGLRDEENRRVSLINALRAAKRGTRSPNVFLVRLQGFEQLPKSNFSYWLSESLLEKFRALPPLDKDVAQRRVVKIADVKVGLQTGSDEIFVRQFWEIRNDDIGRSSKWIPFSKGGMYSPYYGDLDLVVFWRDSGKRVKNFVDERGRQKSRPQNEAFYFREGLTYPATSEKGMGSQYLPPGSIPSVKGSGIYLKESKNTWYLLGVLNSRLLEGFLHTFTVDRERQVGMMASLPIAEPTQPQQLQISHLAREIYDLKAAWDAGNEICTRFTTPWLLQLAQPESEAFAPGLGRVLQLLGDEAPPLLRSPAPFAPLLDRVRAIEKAADARLQVLQAQIDEAVYDLYEISPEDRALIERELGDRPPELVWPQMEGKSDKEKRREHVRRFFSYFALQALRQDPDGIVPLMGHAGAELTLVDRVRTQLEQQFGPAVAYQLEQDAAEYLGRPLEEWLHRTFFAQFHVKLYKSRPILWHLSSPSGHFAVMLDYHRLTHDTLPKVRSQYLWPALERARTQLRAAQKQDPPDMKAIGDLEAYIADLEECDRRLESVIQGTMEVELPDWANGPYRNGKPPYDPDLDDGVKVNILPLQAAGLLPVKKVV
jgi:hypothetical protein